MRSKTGWAYALAFVLVIHCAFAGMIGGAALGNLIAPARLDWSAQSTPGLLFVGAFVGLCAGVALGIWLGVRLVRDAKSRHSAAPEGAPIDRAAAKAAGRRRRLAIGTVVGVAIVATIVVAAWPRPICDRSKRSALVAVRPFGDGSAQVRDMPIEEGASAPGGCELVYTVDAASDDVARYYARSLDRLGWTNGLVTTGSIDEFEPINEHPDRIWIERHGWGPVPDALVDLHYGVTMAEVGATSVRVDASVIRYHCAYC